MRSKRELPSAMSASKTIVFFANAESGPTSSLSPPFHVAQNWLSPPDSRTPVQPARPRSPASQVASVFHASIAAHPRAPVANRAKEQVHVRSVDTSCPPDSPETV